MRGWTEETAPRRAAGERLGVAARRLMDIVLPARCAACGAIVASDGGLCGDCWTQVGFISAPVCARLGTPFSYDPGPGAVSPQAIAEPPDYDRARAVARHAGPARALVHSLKFRDRMEVAAMLASSMARAGADLLEGCDLVVPVPLHRGRLFSRRFNQSALLAERIAAAAAIDYDAYVLRRVKPTRQQVGLTARERRRNVSGAFEVAPAFRGAVEGRAVLVVDDVMTTGATANACARALRKAGARGVDVLVYARVVGGEAVAI